MTQGEAEDRILDTLRGEYGRTGEVDWWAARDLCLAAAVPEEFFGPAVDAMIHRRLVDARVDPQKGRCLRLARIGPQHAGRAREAAAIRVGRRVGAAPSTRGGLRPGRTGLLAACLAALLRPLRGLVP